MENKYAEYTAAIVQLFHNNTVPVRAKIKNINNKMVMNMPSRMVVVLGIMMYPTRQNTHDEGMSAAVAAPNPNIEVTPNL